MSIHFRLIICQSLLSFFSANWLTSNKTQPSIQLDVTNGEKMVLLCNWAVPVCVPQFQRIAPYSNCFIEENETELNRNQKQWFDFKHTKYTIVFSLMASCKRFCSSPAHELVHIARNQRTNVSTGNERNFNFPFYED